MLNLSLKNQIIEVLKAIEACLLYRLLSALKASE